ncbi:hypothetical protein GOP47_0005956 [Adiantum capillus-veneris]|uniref:Uncharacterized protein n=1 Tax=Adiantum capillus-veneris TaxID=13818 RepID=A0A9D4V1Y4_ADICA|nr:hypothetical protein GOP47_0005956 [Adiantum capillus-veneris]
MAELCCIFTIVISSSVPSMLPLGCALSVVSSSRLSSIPIPTVSHVRSKPLPPCGSSTIVEKKKTKAETTSGTE